MKRTTKLLALVLALLMLGSCLPLAFAQEDVTQSAATETAQSAPEAETTQAAPEAQTPADADPAATQDTAEPQTQPDTKAPAQDTTQSEAATDLTSTLPLEAQSGSCGETAVWSLDLDGVLTVSGTGDMTAYAEEEDVPWAKAVMQIRRAVLAEGITGIGAYAFNGCMNLETVSLPSTLKTIGAYAFNGCSSLQAVSLPEGLTDVAWYAFCGCSALKTMVFPNSVKTIGSSALAECRAITAVTLPDTLSIVEFHLFRMCHSLKEIKIPKTVKEIGGAAFYNCVQLKEISLPRSVEIINDYAFIGCKSLERVSVFNGACALPEDGRVFPETTVLRGYEGSTLEAFATANERTFESMPDIPEHDHIWGTPVVTKEATCVETGVLTYTCSVCGETQEEAIPLTDHTPAKVPAVAANCKKTGLTEGVACSVCGLVFTPQAILPKTGHTWKNKVTKAKIGSNGKVVATCTVCKTTKTTSIAKINTVKLSATEYIYDGKAKKPTVTVKDSNNSKLKKGTDYTLTYSDGRKNAGTYSVKITFKGNYSGSKTLKFKILPAGVTNLKVSAVSGRRFYLSWNKAAGAKKYVVYYAASKNGAYTKLGTYSKTSLTIGTFTAGKTYYFKVRAVATVDGKNHFGAYSSVRFAKARW